MLAKKQERGMKSNEMEHKVKNMFYMNDETLITTEKENVPSNSQVNFQKLLEI